MAATTKKIWKEGYDRLKRTWEKLMKQKKEESQPQLALQPVRNPQRGLPVAGKKEKNY